MVTPAKYHTPVLLEEAMEYLALRIGGTYVDATLGGGGYSEAMLQRAEGSRVYGFDVDPDAHAVARTRLARFGDRFEIVAENFGVLATSLAERGVRSIDGIVYDLGVSSHQFDTASVGLSYRVTAPLDMRLDPRIAVSAREIVAEADETELRRILREYGEEPHAGRIARRIAEARRAKAIETTTELAAIACEGIREDKRNETLSRVFQALRIEVNDELGQLRSSLVQAIDRLAPGGRIVVVSYHSLEDRIVKECFRAESAPRFEAGSLGALRETIDTSRARLRLVTRKPVVPTAAEIERNPRARSARLRAAERIEATNEIGETEQQHRGYV